MRSNRLGTVRGTGSSCAWRAGRARRAGSSGTSVLVLDDRHVDPEARSPASLIRNEHSMSAVRYHRNLLVEQPHVADHVPTERHQVASIASTSGHRSRGTHAGRRSRSERTADPDARIIERGLERREHVPLGSTDPSIARTIRPRERLSPAFVPRPIPSRPRAAGPRPPRRRRGSVSVTSATTYGRRGPRRSSGSRRARAPRLRAIPRRPSGRSCRRVGTSSSRLSTSRAAEAVRFGRSRPVRGTGHPGRRSPRSRALRSGRGGRRRAGEVLGPAASRSAASARTSSGTSVHPPPERVD